MKIVNKKKFIIVISIAILLLLTIIGLSIYLVNHNKVIPTISLIGEENIKLQLNDNYNEQGVKAFIKENDISNTVKIDGAVDTTKPGEYKLKYTLFDSKNKNPISVERVISVVDTTIPTISLKGKSEVITNLGEEYKDEGCTAQDNFDGDITNKVSITGEVDTNKEGEYTITYSVEDSSGNKAETTRKVTVVKKATSNKKTVTTLATPSKTNTAKKGLPVLMYHFFYDAKKGEKGNDANWMEVSAFEEQMKYLSENNFYFPSWSEIEEYITGNKTLPDKSVVITIDDGDKTFIDYAIPIIEKYNVKATSFVVTSWNGDWLPNSYKSSHLDFESHSHDMHRAGANGKGRFINLPYKEALEDVTKSKNIIGNCTVFCYPFGHYNDTAKKVLKDAGYKLAFTTQGGRVYPGQDKFALPRVRMSKGISMSAFKESVK